MTAAIRIVTGFLGSGKTALLRNGSHLGSPVHQKRRRLARIIHPPSHMRGQLARTLRRSVNTSLVTIVDTSLLYNANRMNPEPDKPGTWIYLCHFH